MMMLIVFVVGLIFGGWIFDNYLWLWIFYVNILVGIVVVVVMWVIYCNWELVVCCVLIDGVGFVLLVVWVGLL